MLSSHTHTHGEMMKSSIHPSANTNVLVHVHTLTHTHSTFYSLQCFHATLISLLLFLLSVYENTSVPGDSLYIHRFHYFSQNIYDWSSTLWQLCIIFKPNSRQNCLCGTGNCCRGMAADGSCGGKGYQMVLNVPRYTLNCPEAPGRRVKTVIGWFFSLK